jgi:hypothetical protein
VRSIPFVFLIAACSSSSTSPAQPDAAPDIDAPAQSDAPENPVVTFSYTPAWDGVTSVEVLGAFGQSTDWTAPLVTLTASGGTFTGTAQLPPGTYLYVFHAIGDTNAGSAKAPTYAHYAIDPANPSWAPCPAESPTYSAMVANPCSQLTVPVGAPATMYHVTGKVTVNGAGTGGFLVLLEREEASSHHFFVNLMKSAADGTFDMQVAPGQYRVQIQHPMYEQKNDSQLDPVALGTLRRDISASFPVADADVAVGSAEMAFASYAAFTPTGTGTLPTTFSFGTTASSRLDVYGGTTEIGDPWYNGTATTTGGATFDGTFNTTKAGTTTVTLGTKYYWGLEQARLAVGTGPAWTAQTMVFAITWN